MTRSNTAQRAQIEVRVVRLPHGEGLPLPAYQTEGAAGLDLMAALPADTPLRLQPMARALVPTGLVLELPPGTEAQVRPRSGLALKLGVTVLNSPGTIDSDYRGELQVLLVNLGSNDVVLARGERIAQLVIQPVLRALLVETLEAGSTSRGAGGFGSTGTAGNSDTPGSPARDMRPGGKGLAAQSIPAPPIPEPPLSSATRRGRAARRGKTSG